MRFLVSVRACGFALRFALFIFCSAVLNAQWTGTIYNGKLVADKEVLIRAKTLDAASLARLQSAVPSGSLQRISSSLPLIRIRSNSEGIASLVQTFAAHPDVSYVEPNYIVRASATPNDPGYSSLWNLVSIGAPAAWDVTKGSASIAVGIVDTGISYDHPDLAANVWSAPTAFTVNINGNDIACPAGSHGFNAITNTCDPKDDRNHGTHIAGTIGAVGNNSTGVAGINWNAKLLGLKFLDSTGTGTTSDAIKAIEFALQTKAYFSNSASPLNLRVLSNSWGGDAYSQALVDEINKANTNDVLFVVAAGNSAADISLTPAYPGSYTLPNVVTVAATDNTDRLASFSNYGAATVHIAAPGLGIYSTIGASDYGYMSGTSMATPHVSGAAALMLSSCPALTTASVKNALLTTVDPVAALADKVITGGRLNVNAAVRYCPTAQAQAPVSLFPTSAPSQFDTSARSQLELGLKFRATVAGSISRLRYYRASGDTVAHLGSLWTSNGIRLATATFAARANAGWQEVSLASPVAIAANTTYIVSYYTETVYAADDGYFTGQGASSGTLQALKDGLDGPNGVMRTGSGGGFPSATALGRNFWVDVVFTPDQPRAASIAVLSGSGQSATVGAAFTSPLQVRVLDASSNPVSGASVTFTAPASGASATMSGLSIITVVSNLAGVATSPTPIANLAAGAYTVTASAPGVTPAAFTLTNSAATAGSDKTLFGSNPVSATFYSDTNSVELGVRFRSDQAGSIKGIRFFKNPADTSAHTGSLWTSTGLLLATGTFTNESSAGWQQLNFAAPVSITANTTYIASYHTSSGFYYTWNQFDGRSVDNAPLHALANGVDGANGLYRYGSGLLFPNQSYLSSNYWVDVVFAATGTSTTQPQFVTAVAGTPQTANTGASFGAALQAKVTDSSSNPIAGVTVVFSAPSTGASALFNGSASVSVTTGSNGIAVSPTPVANSSAGTYNVVASVTGLSPASFSLTNAAIVPSGDVTLFSGTPAGSFYSDGSSIEVGVRFRSDTAGYVKGIRFYKNSQDKNVHTGSLWTASGALLATGTFTNESASGWQQLNFASAVAISANTTYIASYHTTSGFYYTWQYFQSKGADNPPLHALVAGLDGANGLYAYGAGPLFPNQSYLSSNYWVDIVFASSAPAAQPQMVAAVSGNSQIASVGTSFGAALQAKVTDASANPLAGISVTFTSPSSGAGALFNGSSSVTVQTNSSGIAVSPLPVANGTAGAYTVTASVTGLAPASYSLTNTAAASIDKNMFGSLAPPTSYFSDGPIELGVRFRSDVNGYIKGIRFYKAPGDTSQHTGSLWSSSGVLLATGSFVNETASGWQQMTFANPVPIFANTTYVASYHTNGGFYFTWYFFNNTFDNGQLHALRDGLDGANGVYLKSAGGVFPNLTYASSNYWVDVVFSQ